MDPVMLIFTIERTILSRSMEEMGQVMFILTVERDTFSRSLQQTDQ